MIIMSMQLVIGIKGMDPTLKHSSAMIGAMEIKDPSFCMTGMMEHLQYQAHWC